MILEVCCPVDLGCCCDVSQGPVGGTGIGGFPGLRVRSGYHVPMLPMPEDIMSPLVFL